VDVEALTVPFEFNQLYACFFSVKRIEEFLLLYHGNESAIETKQGTFSFEP
jgi:hypothetical protein